MSSMLRRHFLQQSAAVFAGVSSLLTSSCGESGRIRPNVLMVVSDDQSYPHAGSYGSTMVKTPAFDRIAAEGVLFTNAFVSAPSCGPSRGAILSGQQFYRLQEASMNHTVWPNEELVVYPDEFARDDYHVGFTGKGWGPGNWEASGRTVSPTGKAYNERKSGASPDQVSEIDYAENFEAFLDENTTGAPFCFWAGILEPHRPFSPGIGQKHGKQPEQMVAPEFLPDTPETRGDLADYAYEIEWYDQQLGRLLEVLEKRGQLDNTIIVVTADNGMAFPRAKGNLYDYGTHVPLAIRWGDVARGGRVVEDFVSHCDLAPTLLEAAGLRVPGSITGTSLMYQLESREQGIVETSRDAVVMGIERHLPGSRPEGAGYPSRAIRTKEYLYIHNFAPERNPVGDHPGIVWPEDDSVGGFGDTDGGRTKTEIFRRREEDPTRYQLAFGIRPAEELYRIADDPFQMKNLANDPALTQIKQALAARLTDYLWNTQDPRLVDKGAPFDETMTRFPVLGANANVERRQPPAEPAE